MNGQNGHGSVRGDTSFDGGGGMDKHNRERRDSEAGKGSVPRGAGRNVPGLHAPRDAERAGAGRAEGRLRRYKPTAKPLLASARKWYDVLGLRAKYVINPELDGPVLLLIEQDSTRGYIYENVKEGEIEVERGDKEGIVKIPGSKIISFPDGDGGWTKVWIASDTEGVAYPTEVKHDSRILKLLLDEARQVEKDFEQQKLKFKMDALIKMLPYIILAVLLFMMFGPQLAKVIQGFFPAAAPAAAAATADVNGLKVMVR